MSSSFQKSLQLVTGKGGVGKSTVVAALARAAALRGERPLVVELGHHATMGGLFGAATITYEPALVGPGIHAMNIELLPALREFALRYVHFERVVDRLLSNAQLARFFQAAPGVLEVLTLSKIHALVAERQGGRSRWQPVIVDLDATGHALMLLDLPHVLSALVQRGPLRRMLRDATRLLSDPDRCCVHLVTLPRPLVVQETVELHARLQQDHAPSFGALIVNRVPPTVPLGGPLPAALERVAGMIEERPDPILAAALRAWRLAATRSQRASASMARLETLGLSLRRVADLPIAGCGIELVNHVAAELGVER